MYSYTRVNCAWLFDDVDIDAAFEESTPFPSVLIDLVKSFTFGQPCRYSVYTIGNVSQIHFEPCYYDGPQQSIRSLRLSEPLIVQPSTAVYSCLAMSNNKNGLCSIKMNRSVHIDVYDAFLSTEDCLECRLTITINQS